MGVWVFDQSERAQDPIYIIKGLISVLFYCVTEKSYCYTAPCKNGGTCTETDTGFECICSSQWNCIDCSCSGKSLLYRVNFELILSVVNYIQSSLRYLFSSCNKTFYG